MPSSGTRRFEFEGKRWSASLVGRGGTAVGSGAPDSPLPPIEETLILKCVPVGAQDGACFTVVVHGNSLDGVSVQDIREELARTMRGDE